MFIKAMSCVSVQESYHDSMLEHGIKTFNSDRLSAEEPEYKDIIPARLLRRMSKLVRMSVATAMPLIDKSKEVDGIIIGSSNGSIERSLRFLNQIIDYKEDVLSPTDFVQSTPNCVAGVLALMGKITGYNASHVNMGLSFESSLLDGFLVFENSNCKQLLIGGGDELSEASYNIGEQRDLYKDEPISTAELLHSATKRTIPGEGVAMFVVDAEKNKESIAEIVDVDMISHATQEEVLEKIDLFLAKHNLISADIDGVFVGRNGDCFTDQIYDYLQDQLFPTQNIYTYKGLTGEYPTVSAFAVWMATKLLSGTPLPLESVWKETKRENKNILLYNVSEGTQHGFILMRVVKK
jgi:3-oxoacyl-(acyl-carrier-protein) synthase